MPVYEYDMPFFFGGSYGEDGVLESVNDLACSPLTAVVGCAVEGAMSSGLLDELSTQFPFAHLVVSVAQEYVGDESGGCYWYSNNQGLQSVVSFSTGAAARYVAGHNNLAPFVCKMAAENAPQLFWLDIKESDVWAAKEKQ